jgi:hypothetical protein
VISLRIDRDGEVGKRFSRGQPGPFKSGSRDALDQVEDRIPEQRSCERGREHADLRLFESVALEGDLCDEQGEREADPRDGRGAEDRRQLDRQRQASKPGVYGEERREPDTEELAHDEAGEQPCVTGELAARASRSPSSRTPALASANRGTMTKLDQG